MSVEPRATYRVQLNSEFGFDDAGALAAYLADLGISHLYTSPYLQAATGSTHGYDVVDHSRVNRELGGERWHRQMLSSLADHGLGHLLDIVPNHMAITGAENAWWWDVLENGPSSRYAAYFDVDWDPPEAKLRNVVLIPVLEDHYGRVLESGKIRLVREGGAFMVRYENHLLPLAPPTLDALLLPAHKRHPSDELESIATALGRLPPSTATDRASVRERHRDKEVLRGRLEHVLAEPALADAVDAVVDELNADIDALDGLLERQNYRLSYWRTAGTELDYRRFFNITTLVGLRIEDEQVFDDTHALVLGWVEEGVVDGVRVDHIDGLRDPQGYLTRLADKTRGAWVVVEKILERDESLRAAWPVAGTTGYEFCNRVLGLFIEPTAEAPLTALYGELTGETTDWPAVARAKRHQVMAGELAADVARLTHLFVEVCERNRRYRDYTRPELRSAIEEVVACFPVYRTYVEAASGRVDGEDERRVGEAVSAAKGSRPDIDSALFDFLADVVLLRASKDEASAAAELAMRFQQFTGPVMAKGLEDTAFYTYNRFIALNEVGGDPGTFGTSVEEFHAANEEAQRSHPLALLATSTHDTKRSEDVRARLALLSEVPMQWAGAVRRWFERNAQHRPAGFADANAEYLLYQTLVGAFPLTAERALAFMAKATREAKVQTSWTDPNPSYDEALASFVERLMTDEEFTRDLQGFVQPLVTPGRVNALAQTLLKLTSPGVPDIYQGTELWDLSLVDPDNRRPVDYARRRQLLAEIEDLPAGDAWARAYEGLPKMLLIRRALELRSRRPGLFDAASTYTPLHPTGFWRDKVVAFSRGDAAVTVVPRLLVGLTRAWEDTSVELPKGHWRNELTREVLEDGGVIPVARLFERFPVALLSRL